MRVSDNISDIFAEIKGFLLVWSGKNGVPNKEQVVDGWLSQAFIIARKFDDGELVKKALVDKKLVEFDPAVHSQEQFVKGLKKYLITCFVNEYFRNYKKNKKFAMVPDHLEGEADTNFIDQALVQSKSFANNRVLESGYGVTSANVSDVKQVVDADIKKLTAMCSNIMDLTNIRFLQAISTYCDDVISRYGNIIAINDLDAGSGKSFLSKDFCDDLESNVRKNLCKMILSEDNPAIIERLGVLINPLKVTLKKRLARYFHESNNCIAIKLKRKLS